MIINKYKCLCSVVVDFTNTMPTTFDFNFDLNQAVKHYGYTKAKKSREFINQE